MKQGRFDRFVQMMLVSVSQMAYLEEAHKTQNMIQILSDLFRYYKRADMQVSLKDEITALHNYIDLQKKRYGNRFEIDIDKSIGNKETVVQHLIILDFFDNILNAALVNYEGKLSFTIEFDFKDPPFIKVNLKTAKGQEEFIKNLAEKEHINV